MSSTKKKGGASAVIERRLLRSRSVLLFGPIEPKLTERVFAQVLALDQISQEKPIKVLVNSPGGVADDGFAIYDLLRFVKAPVTTIVTGLAASAATIVLVGAPKERRLILPNSRVMLHQPSVGVQGTASDIAISAKEILRLRKKANELFVRETGQKLERLEEDMHRDYWMNAEECVEYGLIGKVVESAAELD
jgi:ATP-dependent Clp protease protease subunit